MAQPDTLNGVELFIKIGDGATPTETFAHPCTISASRGITFRSNNNSILVPDCDNPSDPAWQQIVKDALSAGVNGEGIVDADATLLDTYTTWWKSKDPKNVQVWIGTVGYWSGAFHLTEWALTGERGNKITNTLTLESDGEISDFTAGP